MRPYDSITQRIRGRPMRWLVTGAAGFIGSNLTELLLELGQSVVGLDNFATGHRRNLEEVTRAVGPVAAERFRFMEGDIRVLDACQEACAGVDIVLHQAALGSVPRSLNDPILTNQANIDGFLNMLVAARDASVKRFVFAASSSTYGDHPDLPKIENRIGRPLSPYAVTKYVNELYAGVFQRAYGLPTVGLRYFNVFGRRQDPNGAYAAVIPRWVGELFDGEPCKIFGDGETSRDFCYIDNVLQANILAALGTLPQDPEHVYNVGCNGQTTLTQLFAAIRTAVARHAPGVATATPEYLPFRPGDVRHSRADISKITHDLGYGPTHTVFEGLAETVDWFAAKRNELVASDSPRPRSGVAAVGMAS